MEHPECIHKGDGRCRYIISWKEPLFLRVRAFRNKAIFLAVVLCLAGSAFLPWAILLKLLAGCAFLALGLAGIAWYLESKEYRRYIEDQALTAEMLMAESNARFNEATLIQEVGQAISRTLEIDRLLDGIMNVLENRLDFERGVIFLANEDKTRLEFRAGYGLTPVQEVFLRENRLRLDREESKGPFVLAFKEKRPLLIDDAADIAGELSERSQEMLHLSESTSFICVPIVFEDESLGVLAVDRTRPLKPIRHNDLNILMGIAPQIAISIDHARTFERLQESEEKYRDLVEGASSIILRLDASGVITFANRFACEFYGYEEHEMVGQKVLGFIVPETSSFGRDLRSEIERFLAEPVHKAGVENENVRRDGQRVWVSWSTKVLSGRGGSEVEILCVGNDVTARRMAEKEKRELEMQLIRSQKMEAIGNLAGGVAHDLNNILSGLTGYPELLIMELPEGSKLRKIASTIKKSGDKAAAMVQDLLTLARRGVASTGVVDLNRVVNEYMESPEFRRLKEYHPGVSFQVELDESLSFVKGSEMHLGKTLMNLVSNAAEAITNEGLVTIRTSNIHIEETLNGFETVSEGDYVVLSVEDTGIGISDEDQKKIFEPFFTKKVMGRSGTGLGMTVVWSTVKDHRGHIDMMSAPGKGTRFDLYFPATHNAPENRLSSVPITAYAGSESILVVDDTEDQQELARGVLERLGYTVHAVSSGEEALEYLSANQCDLVVLDMILGRGMDGLDTYRRILEIKGAQKAIIASGFTETERVRSAFELGVGRYLHKPYSIDELARAVRCELDRKDPS